MPYKSQAQQAFFHTNTAKRKGISADTVEEYDEASKGMKLPMRVKPKPKKNSYLKKALYK